MLEGTQFIDIPQEQAADWITKSHDESDDFVILSLWAAFERFIIDYIQLKGRKILEESPASFSQRFYERLEKEVEYWKIDDILDILKGIADSQLIGNAKQIRGYRDWVAHRNIKRALFIVSATHEISRVS